MKKYESRQEEIAKRAESFSSIVDENNKQLIENCLRDDPSMTTPCNKCWKTVPLISVDTRYGVCPDCWAAPMTDLEKSFNDRLTSQEGD